MKKLVLLSAFIFSLFLSSEISGQTVIRGPYLQLVTTGSIYIKWRTSTSTSSKVWYGSSPGSLNMSVDSGASTTTEHEMQITGLSANTTYYYAVGYGSTVLAGDDSDHYFNTSPPSNTNQTIRAWVLGNAGNDIDDQTDVRDAFYNYNGSTHIDMMLLLGDNAYTNGTDSEYQEHWFENMYEGRLINSVMWSCFGNRDGLSADSETETGPYYDIFTFPRNGEAGGEPSGTEAYYSFDYGNIHFISLNTDDISRDIGDPMMNWLEDDLDGTTQDWIVVIFHHPPYNGTSDNGSDTHMTETDMREDFVPILEAAGVDLVLSSHHHSYQRSFLINGHHDVSATWDPNTMGIDLGNGRLDGDNAYYKEMGGTGTVYMVAGSAGSTASDPHGYPAMYSALRELGSVLIEVTDLQMDVKFIEDDESIGDYFTIIKQDNPPTVDITSPIDGFYFANPTTTTINATATDPGGSIQKVEFIVNGTVLFTGFSFPFAYNWEIPSNGVYELKAKATDNQENVAISKIKVRVGNGSVCKKIVSGMNDAEEDISGSVSRTSSDLEIVNDGGNQTIGLRFTDLNIPQGAVINDAYIQFTSKNTDNENPRKFDLYAEDEDYPFPFGINDNNLSSRTKTSASVSWYPNFWNSSNQTGPDQKTVQIRSLIQEVVNRGGFNMDSPIVILIDGYGLRVAKSYESDASDAPQLCITFSNCPDGDGDGTCDANDLCPGEIEPGDPCDDGNPGTYNDAQNSSCDCVGTPFDCPLIPGDIGEPCDDGNPDTYDDMINGSCDCVGIAYDCPLLQADFGETCDDGNPNSYNDEITPACICAGIIPSGTETLTSAFVSVSSDDAEQKKSNNSVNLTSSDLEMMVDNGDDQLIGIRFTNLNIPQGMYITSAMIQFSADNIDNQNPCNIEIFGQAIDNAPTFTNGSNNIGSRTKTTAKVDWLPDDWENEDDRGPKQRTVNIAPVIQEIVNRPGYTSSSAIALILDGIGRRRAYSFNGDASKAAEIVIIYDLTGPLPIELLDISARTQQDAIRVDWSTASETNNDFFTIERSLDGRSFLPIGTVKGKGTTTDLSNYTFLDKKPESGLNYYRLKQTDFDGQYSFSRVVSASFKKGNSFQVYPTVVENRVYIHKSGDFSSASTLMIHDITGRLFRAVEIEEDEFTKELVLEDMVPGVYFVSIYHNENVETFKIVKPL